MSAEKNENNSSKKPEIRILKINVICDFAGQKSPVDFYIGYPLQENHPIQFQMNWLGSNKGGNVPSNITESLKTLQQMAIDNDVDFLELVEHAMMDAASQG